MIKSTIACRSRLYTLQFIYVPQSAIFWDLIDAFNTASTTTSTTTTPSFTVATYTATATFYHQLHHRYIHDHCHIATSTSQHSSSILVFSNSTIECC
jgi:hypothetical protein